MIMIKNGPSHASDLDFSNVWSNFFKCSSLVVLIWKQNSGGAELRHQWRTSKSEHISVRAYRTYYGGIMRGLPPSLIILAAELIWERGFSAINVPLSKHACQLLLTDSLAVLLLGASPDNCPLRYWSTSGLAIWLGGILISICDKRWLRWLR